MFPEHIDAGHILNIAGGEYVVARRLPDAFVVRSFDGSPCDRVFGFRELAALRADGRFWIDPRGPARRSGAGNGARSVSAHR